NRWQMLAVPALGGVVRRLWPMLLAVSIGTWAGLGLMTGASTRLGTAVLGGALALYAVSGLAALRLSVASVWQPMGSLPGGAFTGLITAATRGVLNSAGPHPPAVRLGKGRAGQSAGTVVHRVDGCAIDQCDVGGWASGLNGRRYGHGPSAGMRRHVDGTGAAPTHVREHLSPLLLRCFAHAWIIPGRCWF